MKSRQYLFSCIKIAGLLILPVLLFLIPVNWLTEQHTVCLFKNIFGIECWGCGITRAVLSAVHCNFTTAVYYNKLIVIVFPLLVYVWGKMLVRNWRGIKNIIRLKYKLKNE